MLEQCPVKCTGRSRHHHAQRRRDEDTGEDQRPGDQLNQHGDAQQTRVGKSAEQLNGERFMAGRHRPQREEKVVGAADQHPGAENRAADQYQLLQGGARRSLHGARRNRGLRLDAQGEHRAIATDESHAQKHITGEHSSAGDDATPVPHRKRRIPPEHVECDGHTREKHERSVEAQQDGDSGEQLHGLDDVKQMAVKKGKQRLVLQGYLGEVSRLRVYVNEVLETRWNHPGREPKSYDPNCVFHFCAPYWNRCVRPLRLVRSGADPPLPDSKKIQRLPMPPKRHPPMASLTCGVGKI